MKTMATRSISSLTMALFLTAQLLISVVAASSTAHDEDEFLSFKRRTAEDDHGDDHDEDHHDEDHADEGKPWGLVIGYTILVNLVTLVGVVFLIPATYRWFQSKFSSSPPVPPPSSRGTRSIIDVVIPSFASGALLATAFYIVIPEALHLIQKAVNAASKDDHADHRLLEGDEEGHEEEGHEEHAGEIPTGAVFRFSTAVLGGFCLPLVLDIIFPRHADADEVVDEEKNEKFEEEDVEGGPIKTVAVKTIDKSLALSVLIGDGFHNFCDGVFIGVAFKLCDRTTAYSIVFVTVYHEIAQELADYFILTRQANLSPLWALTLNFITGLSVVLGGIIVLATNVSDMFNGVILAITVGVYMHIATCDCLPKVMSCAKRAGSTTLRTDLLIAFAMFIVGALPIALASLRHTHCEEEGHEEDH